MDHIFEDNQPIYLQIKHRICARILRGEFQAGQKLPAVIDAAMQYRVNHNTIQRVYQELVRDGIAMARRGEGTFVTQDENALRLMKGELEKDILETFVGEMLRLGHQKDDLTALLQAYLSRSEQQD